MSTSRGKAFLNGLLALLIGFALYMVPAFVIAFRMGFEMGPKGIDSATISTQISRKITQMYSSSWALNAGLTIIIGLLVLWRAWAVAKRSEQKHLVNGLIVGAVPAVLMLIMLSFGGFSWTSLAVVLAYLLAGLAGGYLAERK